MITFKQFFEAATKPSGNYMSLNVDASIILPGMIPPSTGTEVTVDKQHVTLIYSKESSLDPASILQTIESEFPVVVTAQGVEFAAFDSLPKDGERDENKATLVIKLKSPLLDAMNQRLISLGCKHSYPEYSAHVSLYYDVDRKECHQLVQLLNRVVKLPTDISLSGYKSDKIIEDWHKSLN